MKTKAVEDTLLVEQAKQGDLQAFRALVERYQNRIYNAIYRVVGHADDADNLLQETFFKAYKALQGFKEEAQFSTWIYRIAMNHCASHLRKLKTVKHQRPMSLDAPANSDQQSTLQLASDIASPDDNMIQQERQVMIQQTILELEPDLRRILVLKDIDDRSYEEIADIIGCPLGTVKSRLFKARELLRAKLTRYLQ